MEFYAALNDFEATLRPRILEFVQEILPQVAIFAGVITIIFVGYKVVKSFLGENERLDPSTLVRPCLTLAALVLYTQLVTLLIERPIGLVNNIIEAGSTSVGGAAPGDYTLMRDIMTHSQDTGGDDGGGVYDIIQVHPILELMHIIVFFIASVAGGYILFRQLIVKSIYLIIGPFALAFSLVVGNEQVLNKWFQGFVSVLLWLPILSIIQTILILIPIQTTEFDASDIIFSMALQVVMIFCVFKVPQYANILVVQGTSMGQQYGESIKRGLGTQAKGALGKLKSK